MGNQFKEIASVLDDRKLPHLAKISKLAELIKVKDSTEPKK